MDEAYVVRLPADDHHCDAGLTDDLWTVFDANGLKCICSSNRSKVFHWATNNDIQIVDEALMADVIPFPTPTASDPMDDIAILLLEINGKGEIDMKVNSYCETVEQHNWLIAKLTEAASYLVGRKKAGR